MSQIVLPNTIDAGTPASAAEVQGNFTSIRDVVNGGLEGGTSSASNMKAKGLTIREFDAVALKYTGMTGALQQGVFVPTELKVTPGAGLGLNYTGGRALVVDDGSVHTSGILIPANVTASGAVTAAANASGNPRIDQVVLTLSGPDAGSVAIVQGTPTALAHLDNRLGAAALPAKSIRLADVLVPNGFAGPFVAGTHIRDRRPWAKGAFAHVRRNSNASAGNDYVATLTSPVAMGEMGVRLETQGNPVRVQLLGSAQISAAPNSGTFYTYLDVANADVQSIGQTIRFVSAAADHMLNAEWYFNPAAGSHTYIPYFAVSAGTMNVLARAAFALNFIVEELLQPSNGNGVMTGGVL